MQTISLSRLSGARMKTTHRAVVVAVLGAIMFGSTACIAYASPPTPPPNPGGHYGAAYQDLLNDPDLMPNINNYDINGRYILTDMFGTVCNNPGYVCM
ncbi:hypothetical protein ABIA30_002010 [Mycobacterium sp. MAA66]|uniref:hypothetical protein n=1 Tax=Mycobacterium sp. MAA66 TaxID=3156297 RepID=UPI003519C350